MNPINPIKATDAIFKSIPDLLVHRPPMILIDEIIDWGEDFVEAAVHHRVRHSFWDDQNNIPAYVGLEYMAQTIGLYSGIVTTLAGGRPSIGLLLGTRHYSSNVSHFEQGQAVNIRVAEVYRNEHNMSVFDCWIRGGAADISAQIKAIQPHDLEEILRQQN